MVIYNQKRSMLSTKGKWALYFQNSGMSLDLGKINKIII